MFPDARYEVQFSSGPVVECFTDVAARDIATRRLPHATSIYDRKTCRYLHLESEGVIEHALEVLTKHFGGEELNTDEDVLKDLADIRNRIRLFRNAGLTIQESIRRARVSWLKDLMISKPIASKVPPPRV